MKRDTPLPVANSGLDNMLSVYISDHWRDSLENQRLCIKRLRQSALLHFIRIFNWNLGRMTPLLVNFLRGNLDALISQSSKRNSAWMTATNGPGNPAAFGPHMTIIGIGFDPLSLLSPIAIERTFIGNGRVFCLLQQDTLERESNMLMNWCHRRSCIMSIYQ